MRALVGDVERPVGVNASADGCNTSSERAARVVGVVVEGETGPG